jgi:hypothetical protein
MKSTAGVKNEWSCTVTDAYAFMVWCLISTGATTATVRIKNVKIQRKSLHMVNNTNIKK